MTRKAKLEPFVLICGQRLLFGPLVLVGTKALARSWASRRWPERPSRSAAIFPSVTRQSESPEDMLLSRTAIMIPKMAEETSNSTKVNPERDPAERGGRRFIAFKMPGR